MPGDPKTGVGVWTQDENEIDVTPVRRRQRDKAPDLRRWTWARDKIGDRVCHVWEQIRRHDGRGTFYVYVRACDGWGPITRDRVGIRDPGPECPRCLREVKE